MQSSQRPGTTTTLLIYSPHTVSSMSISTLRILYIVCSRNGLIVKLLSAQFEC